MQQLWWKAIVALVKIVLNELIPFTLLFKQEQVMSEEDSGVRFSELLAEQFEAFGNPDRYSGIDATVSRNFAEAARMIRLGKTYDRQSPALLHA